MRFKHHFIIAAFKFIFYEYMDLLNFLNYYINKKKISMNNYTANLKLINIYFKIFSISAL